MVLVYLWHRRMDGTGHSWNWKLHAVGDLYEIFLRIDLAFLEKRGIFMGLFHMGPFSCSSGYKKSENGTYGVDNFV